MEVCRQPDMTWPPIGHALSFCLANSKWRRSALPIPGRSAMTVFARHDFRRLAIPAESRQKSQQPATLWPEEKEQAMTGTNCPIYRWRVGEVEITRVLEFEAALFEPAVIHPEASSEIIARHRAWLEPTLMDPASGLMIFAFHSTVIKTPRATILVDTCSGNDKERPH